MSATGQTYTQARDSILISQASHQKAQQTITVTGLIIDVSDAHISVEDHNHNFEFSKDPHVKYDASMVEVLMGFPSLPFGWVYQTSTTIHGGLSSQLEVNHDSGAIDAIKKFLIERGVVFNEDEEYEIIREFGKELGDMYKVQQAYDSYLEDLGTWEPYGGVDANSEIFVYVGDSDQSHESE